MKAIILLSSERSGSNLLRTKLGQKLNVHTPVSPQLFKAFRNQLNKRHILSKEKLSKLGKLCFKLTQTHLAPWDLPLENILNQFQDTDCSKIPKIQNILFDVYHEYARQNDHDNFFLKENYIARYLNISELSKRYTYYYIYLIRDPRDVFLSYKKVPGGPNTKEVFCTRWLEEQAEIEQLLASIPNEFKIKVKYENLLVDIDKTIENIKDNFGLSDEFIPIPNVIELGKSPYFKNLDKPILKSNNQKFLKELSSSEIKYIESKCFSALLQNGYKVIYMDKDKKFKESIIKSFFSKILNLILIPINYLSMVEKNELKTRIKRVLIMAKIRTI